MAVRPKAGETAKNRPYDASVEIQQETSAYDASVVKNLPPLQSPKMTASVITVRSERGYSGTYYDASVVKLPKTLRRQFGQKYDAKKVRNNFRKTTMSRNKFPVSFSIS